MTDELAIEIPRERWRRSRSAPRRSCLQRAVRAGSRRVLDRPRGGRALPLQAAANLRAAVGRPVDTCQRGRPRAARARRAGASARSWRASSKWKAGAVVSCGHRRAARRRVNAPGPATEGVFRRSSHSTARGRGNERPDLRADRWAPGLLQAWRRRSRSASAIAAGRGGGHRRRRCARPSGDGLKARA